MTLDTPGKPKRLGRPSLPDDERKSTNLKFRARAGIRSRLEESAKVNERSLSEEIEFRLEKSYEHSSISDAIQAQFYRNMKIMFGGSEGLDAAVAFGRAWDRAHAVADKHFGDDVDWTCSKDKQEYIEEYFKGIIRMIVNGLKSNIINERKSSSVDENQIK